MRIELKGLLAALIAALIVLGGVFGIAAIISDNQKPGASAPAAAPASNSMASPQMIANGHAFFTQSCASCHGASGGGAFGPNLHYNGPIN